MAQRRCPLRCSAAVLRTEGDELLHRSIRRFPCPRCVGLACLGSRSGSANRTPEIHVYRWTDEVCRSQVNQHPSTIQPKTTNHPRFLRRTKYDTNQRTAQRECKTGRIKTVLGISFKRMSHAPLAEKKALNLNQIFNFCFLQQFFTCASSLAPGFPQLVKNREDRSQRFHNIYICNNCMILIKMLRALVT